MEEWGSRTLCAIPTVTVVLLATACSTGTDGDDDDSAGPDPGCSEGFVDDGGECVPEDCGAGLWGDLDVGGDTLFVRADADDGGDGSQDAPLRSIQAGLDLAGQEGAAVVAVAAGSYPEVLVLSDDHGGIHLAAFDEGTTVHLEGVTIADTLTPEEAGWGTALSVQDGASCTAVDCILERASTAAVLVGYGGAQLELDGTEIRDTQSHPTGQGGYGVMVEEQGSLVARSCLFADNRGVGLAVSPGAYATLDQVEIRDTVPDVYPVTGYGIQVGDGGILLATGIVLDGNTTAGIVAVGAGADVTLDTAQIRGTHKNQDGNYGYGIVMDGGAQLVATDCTFADNHGAAVLAAGSGTVATLSEPHILNTGRNANLSVGVGLLSQSWAILAAQDATVTGCQGPGLWAAVGGLLACEGCSIEGNTFASALVTDGQLELTGSQLSGAMADANLGGGVGVFAGNLYGGPGSLLIRESEISGSQLAAVWLDQNGSYQILDSDLSGGAAFETAPQMWIHGDGVYATGGGAAWDGSTGILLHGNTIHDCAQAGVFLCGASATLEDNSWAGNGIDLTQQYCDGVDEPVGAELVPNVDLCPFYDDVVQELQFTLSVDDVVLQE